MVFMQSSLQSYPDTDSKIVTGLSTETSIKNIFSCENISFNLSFKLKNEVKWNKIYIL